MRAQSGALGAWLTLRFGVAPSSARGWRAAVTPYASHLGPALALQSGDDPAARRFFVPAAHGGEAAAVTLALDAGATLLTGFGSADAGRSHAVPLGPSGSRVNFTFTVTAQSGRPEHSDAVTLEFVVLPSDVDSWLAWVWAPGAEPRLLSEANATAHGLFRLPESAAGQSAHIGFALPYGAGIAPADQAPAVPLGATGTNTTYAFTVTAQSGQGADDHALTFAVAPSSDRSWTATLTAPGFRQELTPDSAGALTLPEAAAHGEATLTLTLPYGATVAPTRCPCRWRCRPRAPPLRPTRSR